MAMMAKMILLVAGLSVGDYAEGTGAYYHEVSLREVCERRERLGWLPNGATLDCAFPCLAAAISSGPSELGDYWLVDLPGASLHI